MELPLSREQFSELLDLIMRELIGHGAVADGVVDRDPELQESIDEVVGRIAEGDCARDEVILYAVGLTEGYLRADWDRLSSEIYDECQKVFHGGVGGYGV